MLLYRTGDDSGQSPEDPAIWQGLYPVEKQVALNEQAGIGATVGAEWAALEAEAALELSELAATEGVEQVAP